MVRKVKEPVIKVPLKDIYKVCHICGEISDTTRQRSYRGTNFQGSCGDSFCFAGCDMSSCRGVSAIACKTCEDTKRPN